MNILSVLGFCIAIGVFLVAVLTSTDNPRSMMDMHGALIVIGGTIGACAISFQLDRLVLMFKVFVIRTLRGKKPDYRKTIRDLMEIAELYRTGSGNLQTTIANNSDHFLKECMGALLDDVIPKEDLFRVLHNRSETMFKRYNEDALKFKATGKYPPAMGLMGAVLGMIALLGGLGKPGAEKTIGPAMSVALVATFYGIALANLVVLPIGDNLSGTAAEMKSKNKIIIEGVKLISKKTNPIILAEELNSFLLPSERIDWKKEAAK